MKAICTGNQEACGKIGSLMDRCMATVQRERVCRGGRLGNGGRKTVWEKNKRQDEEGMENLAGVLSFSVV